jgi:hypothetical protein
MTDKIFDQAFLGRLSLAVKSVERDGLKPTDPAPLAPEDYAVIFTAYAEGGGDPAAAKELLGAASERCGQALARILQFIADQYHFGPIEELADDKLLYVARDAVEATERWMNDVELHDAPPARESPLGSLLQTHYRLGEEHLDLHDRILWPLARWISPEH